MSLFDVGDAEPRSRRSTAYFSAADRFSGEAPQQLITEESASASLGAPAGILTGGRKRGGVKWRDEHPAADAPAERVKHFDFLDPAERIGTEQEYGHDGFTVPDDTREHPWFANQKSMMNARAEGNARQRTRQLTKMVMALPRAEANANVYAHDLGTDELLSTDKVAMPDVEADDFDAETLRTRRVQNRALGVRGYEPEDRGRVAARANASRAGSKPGFFSRMIDAMGLGRLFGSARTDDRTFDAVPRRAAQRVRPNGWFQRLFGTGRRPGR